MIIGALVIALIITEGVWALNWVFSATEETNVPNVATRGRRRLWRTTLSLSQIQEPENSIKN